jgi:hypothetical protein
MNRSLNLLRPVGARGLASARVKPTALALRQPLPTPFAQSPLAAFGPFGIRRYASSVGKSGGEGHQSGSSGSAERPKANPHADQQNATSSAVEEVCLRFLLNEVVGIVLMGRSKERLGTLRV